MILRVKSPHYGRIPLAIGGYHLFSAHGWEIIKMIKAFSAPVFGLGISSSMKLVNHLGFRLLDSWTGRRLHS